MTLTSHDIRAAEREPEQVADVAGEGSALACLPWYSPHGGEYGGRKCPNGCEVPK